MTGLPDKMRPDALKFTYLPNSKKVWILAVSTKLYSTEISATVVSNDFTSTQYDKFYAPKKPSQYINRNDDKNLRQWKELIEQYNLKECIVGSLRIHVLLPGTATKEKSRIEGDDVIIYIDTSNMNLFFDPKLVDILKKFID